MSDDNLNNSSVENFKLLLEKYKSSTFKTESKPIKNNKSKSKPNKPIPDDLPPIPDLLNHSMKILFIGINPGVQSSQKGRHFGNPRNLFWPLLHQSGLVPTKLTCEDDEKLLEEHSFGFTNLSPRPTVGMDDLTKTELVEGVPVLKQKILEYKPQVCCFLGIQIYRYFISDMKKTIIPGFQSDIFEGVENCKMFVTPSTSGRVVGYTREDRLKCMNELSTWVKENCTDD
ncbi:DNA glycosylase [Conidiobolus coronatus NRRL 28638]|uniref:DNA glycosylase n=1 Tax=Conidiobolus coronatus (strain ATCC 28846 / CBS 209.66 / NRRL 28638) TaxID=796925 RepID=A0A137P2C5_CONC2|nr:DNA glycosylase [Conidiobolus coronatus NRRL 28638]|eukprot:KXN69196.1 DNA glycosylase [Conidiobolus coronatus NRRL 28638]